MRVENTGRKFGADPEYIFTKVDGSPRLFTEEEDARAKQRAAEQPEDLPPIWARVCNWLTLQIKDPS